MACLGKGEQLQEDQGEDKDVDEPRLEACLMLTKEPELCSESSTVSLE